MMGIGLYVGSATAFAIGLTARLSQVDSATNVCSSWQDAGFQSLTRCFDYYDPPTTDSQDVFVGAAYGSSIVMSMIASGALGRYQAWQTAFGNGRVRNPVSRWAFGAIFTGLGVSAIATHFALVYTDARNPCTSWECNVQRRALWIATSDGGALLLNTGFGLLSWGSHYNSNLERYRMRWSVLPGAGPAGSGATATLRF